jgi:hypothetical protein
MCSFRGKNTIDSKHAITHKGGADGNSACPLGEGYRILGAYILKVVLEMHPQENIATVVIGAGDA